jgi:hypothetical protein
MVLTASLADTCSGQTDPFGVPQPPTLTGVVGWAHPGGGLADQETDMGQGAERSGRARARGDQGAALVEFAFVMTLLFILIFGIVSFGLILSFKQDMTRAAAEGARAGAVAFPATNAEADAEAALDEAIQDFGGPNWNGTGCEVGPRAGLSCSATVGPCDAAVPTGEQCVFVDMSYDYDSFPLFGNVPLISELMPNTIDASSVARTND